MGISDKIADFIFSAIEDSGGFAELRRGALAERFSCVPSQINYVLSTRFSPERGYLVESRRGGGGYIRITRIQASPEGMVMHTVNAAGNRLDAGTAAALVSNLRQAGAIDRTAARLLLAAVGDRALQAAPPECRDSVRAGIFKYMLVALPGRQEDPEDAF